MTSMGAITFSKERTVRKGLVTRCQVQSQISSEILTALEKRPKQTNKSPSLLQSCHSITACMQKVTRQPKKCSVDQQAHGYVCSEHRL